MQANSNPPAQDKSLGELFADLAKDSSTLVRQELTLAKAEVTQKAVSAGKDVGLVAAGGFLAYAAFLTLVAALVLLLIEVAHLPGWVSALIVTVVLAIIGGVLAMQGIAGLKRVDPLPRQTIETLQDDVQALRGNK